jgi:predicted dehydrogenase
METPMSRSPLTIAVAGLGSRIAGVITHLAAVAGPRIRLIAYADPEPRGLQQLQQSAGLSCGQAFTDTGTMLATVKPDVLMVGSPNHLHVSMIAAGLAAGCRVFTEKPVALDRAATMEVARLAARHGADQILVGLVLRSSPLFRAVRQLISAGRLGRIISMECNEHLGYEHGGFLMRDWRRKRAYAGSYLLEKCCHDFDLYQGFTGRRAGRVASFGGRDVFVPENAGLAGLRNAKGAEPYQAWRTGWNAGGQVFDSDADVLDHQVALVEYEGGIRLAFHSNTHCAFGQRRWLIAGTRATLEADLATNRIRVQDIHTQATPEEIAVTTGAGAGHYGADEQMGRDLTASLLDGAVFPADLRGALEAGIACMGIDEAQRSGSVIDLAPWWAEFDAAWPVLSAGRSADTGSGSAG